MSEAFEVDCLKLTTYFGERDRTAHGLLGDELMRLYARHRIGASLLLRGAEGFGSYHRLRSDRSLTLSEDLPLVSVAVDRRERVEALVEPVQTLQRRGLVTLEPARLMDLGPRDLDGHLATDLAGRRSKEGGADAVKLTVYLRRRQRVGRQPAFLALCQLLYRRGLDGASVLLGVDGTHRGHRMRAQFFSRNADVPVMLIAVGERARIAAVLPELAAVAGDAPITLQDVRICKRDGRVRGLLDVGGLPAPEADRQSVRRKLMVYTSQSATREGHPLSRQIVRRLREDGTLGATTLHGAWGFHGAHAPHGDRLVQGHRRVPALTVIVDEFQRISQAFELIDELTAEHGLVTSEAVAIASRSGEAPPRI